MKYRSQVGAVEETWHQGLAKAHMSAWETLPPNAPLLPFCHCLFIFFYWAFNEQQVLGETEDYPSLTLCFPYGQVGRMGTEGEDKNVSRNNKEVV